MAKKLSKKNAKARRELKDGLERAAHKVWYDDVDAPNLDVSVSIWYDGNFTAVFMTHRPSINATLEGKGFSKYNPNDEKLGYPYSEERGLQIALGRACADIAKQVYP